MTSDPIRVLIADDQRLIREGIASFAPQYYYQDL